jgi:hypothetical protein
VYVGFWGLKFFGVEGEGVGGLLYFQGREMYGDERREVGCDIYGWM